MCEVDLEKLRKWSNVIMTAAIAHEKEKPDRLVDIRRLLQSLDKDE
jgi:hypothetical protein